MLIGSGCKVGTETSKRLVNVLNNPLSLPKITNLFIIAVTGAVQSVYSLVLLKYFLPVRKVTSVIIHTV
jgi:hypothetical protein